MIEVSRKYLELVSWFLYSPFYTPVDWHNVICDIRSWILSSGTSLENEVGIVKVTIREGNKCHYSACWSSRSYGHLPALPWSTASFASSSFDSLTKASTTCCRISVARRMLCTQREKHWLYFAYHWLRFAHHEWVKNKEKNALHPT